MSDELRAAAERACDAIEACPPEVTHTPAGAAELWLHARRLAKAWRAEHPADDAKGE